MKYAWIITEDCMPLEGYPSRVGTAGPSDAPANLLAALRRHQGEGVAFRMYDDDNNLIYAGRFISDDMTGGMWHHTRIEHTDTRPPAVRTGLGEEAFGPLEDFGTPDAGCTAIKYRCTDGTWAIL